VAGIVVAIIGIPGAGKSLLAAAVAEQMGWSVIDRDQVPGDKPARNAVLFSALAQELGRGGSCVLDGVTLASAEQRDRVRAIAQGAGARAVLVWLDCPLDVALARVAAQPEHPAKDRDAALVRDVAARFESPEADVVRLDARLPTEELLPLLLKIVGGA
jgi:predicted kinase